MRTQTQLRLFCSFLKVTGQGFSGDIQSYSKGFSLCVTKINTPICLNVLATKKNRRQRLISVANKLLSTALKTVAKNSQMRSVNLRCYSNIQIKTHNKSFPTSVSVFHLTVKCFFVQIITGIHDTMPLSIQQWRMDWDKSFLVQVFYAAL